MLLITTIAFLTAACALACLRLSYAIDPGELFYKSHPLSLALGIMLIIFAFIITFICIKKYKSHQLDLSRRFAHSPFGKTCAVLMIAASVLKIISMIANFSTDIIDLGSVFILLLTFISIFYYLHIFTLFNKGTVPKFISATALLPVIWMVAILIIKYIELTQMSTTAQYMYIIFAHVINILFFYYTAKVLSGHKNVVQCLIASAFAAIINAVAYLSPIIVRLISPYKAYAIQKSFIFEMLDNAIYIFISLLALSFIVFLLKESKKEEIINTMQ